MDLLSVLIEFFARCYGRGVMSEKRLKISLMQVGVPVSAKFSHRRRRPPIIIYIRIYRQMNALQLCR